MSELIDGRYDIPPRLQSVFRMVIHQKWLRLLNERAKVIQKHFRGHLVTTYGK